MLTSLTSVRVHFASPEEIRRRSDPFVMGQHLDNLGSSRKSTSRPVRDSLGYR